MPHSCPAVSAIPSLGRRPLTVLLRTFPLALCLFATTNIVPAQTYQADIQRHEQLAREALNRNDFAAAEQEYETLIKLQPGNASYYTGLGVTKYGRGHFAEAQSTLREALKYDALDQTAKTFLALSQADLGNCSEAAASLKQTFDAGQADKLTRLVGLSLLNCDLSSNELNAAFQVASRLRALFPDDADVLYRSAGLYTRLWTDAADQLMQKHPDSYRVHELAGEVFEAQGNDAHAIAEYRLAAEENPKAPRLHFRTGQLLLKQNSGDADRNALLEFEQELSVNPNSAPAEYSIGEILRHQRDLANARKHLERAIALDPHFAEAYIGLAQLDLAQHEPGQAQAQAETAVRLEPGNAQAHYALMLAYRQQGRTDDSAREMTAFQKLQHQSDTGFQARIHSLSNGKTAITTDAPQ
jgi:tetratricopeptide (TPR) repeat protein